MIRHYHPEDFEGVMQCYRAFDDTLSDVEVKGAKNCLADLHDDNKVVILVAENDKIIVGTGMLYLIRIPLHGGVRFGQIENVAVLPNCRGLGVGKLIIENLIEMAEWNSCYKVILSCSQKNVPFYEKCGFKDAEHTMKLFLGDKP